MDIVIPYYHKGGCQLKYTLRSLQKYFLPLERVFIIGDRPPGLNGFSFIEYLQEPERAKEKERIIKSKIALVASFNELSDDFLMCSDDHFLLRPFNDMPYYHEGELLDSWLQYDASNGYSYTLKNTYAALAARDLPSKNFNCHCPIVYNKDLFILTMHRFDWSRPFGYAIKSLYCNSNNLEAAQFNGVKFRKEMKASEIITDLFQKDVFSINEVSLNTHMIAVLEGLYPEKSKWEK